MSEELLVKQCAPTLAGIKTGSLFPCPCDDRESLLADIRRLNRLLVPKGLCLLPIRYRDDHALLYLYRPAELRRDLESGMARDILQKAGYRCDGCQRCVARLIRRFREEGEFPHEVGLFLSYPPEDVQGLSSTAPVISSAPASGRSTATRRRRSGCSPGSASARRSTVPCGAPVPISAG